MNEKGIQYKRSEENIHLVHPANYAAGGVISCRAERVHPTVESAAMQIGSAIEKNQKNAEEII